jgi:hypothetical protein
MGEGKGLDDASLYEISYKIDVYCIPTGSPSRVQPAESECSAHLSDNLGKRLLNRIIRIGFLAMQLSPGLRFLHREKLEIPLIDSPYDQTTHTCTTNCQTIYPTIARP